MSTTPSVFDRKNPTIHPSLSHGLPASPHTPQRLISSTFSSPSNSYRGEEDSLIFEFGARYLRAGVAGEPSPRCSLQFGPDQSRRVGDYRQWLPGYHERERTKDTAENWGRKCELWRMDLRDADLGLVEDKIERALREAYNNYLLLDSKSRRLVLVLPSVLPHQLLSVVLSIAFNNFQCPGATLVAAPAMAIVAAGLRSGVVVDIGWHETTITCLYEFREVLQRQTIRAMRLATLQTASMLQKKAASEDPTERESARMDVSFEQVEDVVTRLSWCRPSAVSTSDPQNTNLADRSGAIHIREDEAESDQVLSKDQPLDTKISMTIPSTADTPFTFSFGDLSNVLEEALINRPRHPRLHDEEEQSIPDLLYSVLLAVPPDVRGICMPRIVITGGGSHIPGLKSRILSELNQIIKEREWNPVSGKAASESRRRLQEIDRNRQNVHLSSPLHAQVAEAVKPDERAVASSLGAAGESQLRDLIQEELRREEMKGAKPQVFGLVRGVETLGAWAGASLVAGMKVRGVVEIERETYLQSGLLGARRETELSTAQSRQSGGPGITRAGIDKVGWTLGPWA